MNNNEPIAYNNAANPNFKTKDKAKDILPTTLYLLLKKSG